MDTLERAETKVALLKEAGALVDQLRQNEAERNELLGRRTDTCKRLRKADTSIADLQSIFGISRSRVQQILR